MVAFFPVYPLSARFTAWITGTDLRRALPLTANGYLIGAFVLLLVYARRRFERRGSLGGDGPADGTPTLRLAVGYTLLALGLFPTSFFFRVPYSESCFLFFAILAMLAMQRGWPLLVVAGVVGLTTAVRPVGIALLPVYWLYVCRGSTNRRTALLKLLLLTPVAAWGLLAYMDFQNVTFGDPLAFARTQEHWSARINTTTSDKALSLMSYEPIWSVYQRGSPAYWRRLEPDVAAPVNLAFANPIYFLLATALVVLGRWKRWLNGAETLLAALLILIPYVTRAYEMCMLSEGRFMAVVFPIYLVLGQILSRIPGPLAALILCFSAFLMAAYAAQFAAGYPLI
jgi:hypothetical protein